MIAKTVTLETAKLIAIGTLSNSSKKNMKKSDKVVIFFSVDYFILLNKIFKIKKLTCF